MSNAGTLIRRSNDSDGQQNQQQIAISSVGRGDDKKGLIRTIQRTSNLDAPIVSLSGAHGGEILSCRFSPTGEHILACSTDRSLSFWNTYAPNINCGHLPSHAKAPITDCQWSVCNPIVYSVSADSTLTWTDAKTGKRIRKVRAHREVINSVDRVMAMGTELVATASDDRTVKIWEGSTPGEGGTGVTGSKNAVKTITLSCNTPITAVAFSQDASQLFIGALDNEIHVWDLRKEAEVFSLTGHGDTPTSLSVSPNGSFLLSPSLSSQLIIHDIRPFSPSPNRVHRILSGSPAGFENTLLRAAWSKDDDGRRVAVGGADRMVCIWDVETGGVLYKLPGHRGTVTCVDFHPKEPIILSGSKDATMLVGEIEASL